MSANDVVWKNGTAGYFASSGSQPTVFWLNGTSYIQHEQIDGGIEYHGSGSLAINLYLVGSGGYLIIGGGEANIPFGVSGIGSYSIHGSGTTEISLNVNGLGSAVQPVKGVGDMQIII